MMAEATHCHFCGGWIRDARISEIRENHGPTCQCSTPWQCDAKYLLASLDALTAERDVLRVERDIARRVEQESSAAADAWQAEAVKVRAERDALAARLAAAESALRVCADAIRNGVWSVLAGGTPLTSPSFKNLKLALKRAESVLAALAGSRERVQGDGAPPVTTRTITMRCHCGRGVTIGPDPWCAGCVQSAATCDCVSVTGEG